MNIAQGRLDYGPPVAVIDIGSNSVRLVVYEGLTRSPTPIFHEKVLAGHLTEHTAPRWVEAWRQGLENSAKRRGAGRPGAGLALAAR